MFRRSFGVATLALASFCLATFLLPSMVFAADATPVVIPIGDWSIAILGSVSSCVVALLGWVVAKWVPAIIRPYLTDQLLGRAVDYAIAVVAGATKGKVLTLPVANQVLAEAASYAVANAPTLAKWLGNTLEPKLIARLSSAGALPAEASKATLGGS